MDKKKSWNFIKLFFSIAIRIILKEKDQNTAFENVSFLPDVIVSIAYGFGFSHHIHNTDDSGREAI